MLSTRTFIAVCLFFAYVANAIQSERRLPLEKPLAKAESLDDICLSLECIRAASWILENGNFSVDPCDDFYEFTCGYVKLAEIPDDEYTRMEYLLSNHALSLRLKGLIEDIDKTKVPKHFGLIRTLYDNCMSEYDSAAVYSDTAYNDIVNELHRPSGWPVLVGSNWTGLNNAIGSLMDTVLKLEVLPDIKNSTHLVLSLTQQSSGLDNEILRSGFGNDIVQAYYKYMIDVAVMVGADRARAEVELKEALLFAISLAHAAPSAAKTFLVSETFHRLSVGEFTAKYSKFPALIVLIRRLLPRICYLRDNDIIMVQGDLDKFVQVLSNVPPRVLGNWLWWISGERELPLVSPVSKKLSDRFHNFMEGVVEASPKWKRCVETVQSNLPLSLSALYQRKYMSQDIVSDLRGIAANIKQRLRAEVQASWFDDESKREYLQKLENMISFLAYRDEYVDDKKIEEIYKYVVLFEGTLEASKRNISIASINFRCNLRTPINRNDLRDFGNIFTGAAFYSPVHNRYSVGAQLTLNNYYHVERPKYMNYATVGYSIAHEMGHSIDSNGIHYDKDSNVREWLSPETKRNFDERVQCIINQYSNYNVEELGVKLNGERLAAENVADHIGLQMTYGAYQRWALENAAEKKLPGLSYTPKQLFWITMGSSFCTKMEKPMLRLLVTRDTHSPSKQRVNGAVMNSPDFAKDFKCKPGAKMNPVQKCSMF